VRTLWPIVLVVVAIVFFLMGIVTAGSGLNVLGKKALTFDRTLMQMNGHAMSPLGQADL
jgi:hypothetical protein